MNLSISNIGWQKEQDEAVYSLLKNYGFLGLEIAPTRIFPETPYENITAATAWADELMNQYGFSVPSMQSIWYGRQEKLFGTKEERSTLLEYTKKAVDFAVSVHCHNLVFGCPRNRCIPENADQMIGTQFFREIGEYAAENGTVIGMEANPPIYNTNYINDTVSAIELIEEVNSPGFLLNLDIGTMIQNKESVDELKGKVKLINHVHISEPGLKPIEKRVLHKQLKEVLAAEGYHGYISIEMGRQVDNIQMIENALIYLKEVFE